MGKKKNRNGIGAGTFLETRMFLSSAFLSLGKKGSSPVTSNCSAQMLIILLAKRDFRGPKPKRGSQGGPKRRVDDNRFKLTRMELADYGISEGRAVRGFDELLAKGFIERVHPGGACSKDASLYALRDDYLRWKPGDPPVRIRGRDVKRGFQGRGLGCVKNNLNTRQRGAPTHASTGGIPTKDTRVNEGHPENSEIEVNA